MLNVTKHFKQRQYRVSFVTIDGVMERVTVVAANIAEATTQIYSRYPKAHKIIVVSAL